MNDPGRSPGGPRVFGRVWVWLPLGQGSPVRLTRSKPGLGAYVVFNITCQVLDARLELISSFGSQDGLLFQSLNGRGPGQVLHLTIRNFFSSFLIKRC